MGCGCGCAGMGQTSMCGSAPMGAVSRYVSAPVRMHPTVAAHTMPGGQQMGGIIGSWWSDVDRLKVRIDPAFQATDADVTACQGKLPAGEVAAWRGFMSSWNTYRADPGGWVFGSAEAYDAGLAFETMLGSWRTQLQADGCALSAPDLPAPPQNPLEAAAPILKWAVVGVGIVGAIYAVSAIRSIV